VFEKFLFEFVSRIGIMLLLLPLLFWITFNLQGYFFTLFSGFDFQAIGISDLMELDVPKEVATMHWLPVMIGSMVLLALVLAFTGAATFSKQPLLKTMFGVAMIFIFFVTTIYVVMEPLGLRHYQPGDNLWLVPTEQEAAFRFFGIVLILANLIMLFVAFRKIKEREV
jgi:cytochrome bd-type quinol oxidase subunit 1